MYKFNMILLFIMLLCILDRVDAFIKDVPLLGKVIYLDAGHGGKDPGAYYKDIYEEDINLSITLKLRNKLEKMGAVVYLTREEDYDLANPNASLRKRSDLGNRAKMINSSDADIYLSIHLNSSTNTSWKGAQVFYYDSSEEGKRLGEILQNALVKNLDSSNHRLAKGNTSYYLLKKTEVPVVIAECGFLSNHEEANLLATESYQEEIAEAICLGIMEYLKEKEAEIL